MDSTVKEKWVARLRELPNEVQGRSLLRNSDDKMCCLGVLTEIAVEEGVIPPGRLVNDRYHYGTWTGVLPPEVVRWSEVSDVNPFLGEHAAGYWNDVEAKNFDEIANLVEEYL